jgi:hypothetical protein
VTFGAGILIGRIFGNGEAGLERRLLEVRAFDLLSRAMVPGSALGCLDAVAGEAFVASCEKAVFATPEAITAAISYVAAQLALLAADDKQRALHTSGGSGVMLAQLRRSIETDRFGIVAHVLSVRDKCTVENCAALAMFVDARKVRAHLATDPFGVRIQRHAGAWHEQASRLTSQTTAVTQGTEVPAAAVRPKTRKDFFYPSSTSIPAISIMTPEPAASQDTSESTSTPQGKSRSRGNGPMRLAPGAQ